MKRSLLLLMTGAVAFGVGAQSPSRVSLFKGNVRQPNNIVAATRPVTPLYQHLAKTTGVPFVTENFGTGTTTSLPTGWTAGSVVGNGTWKWRNVACTGSYSIGTINSTTASNGWMVYDSDSIGANTSALTLEGYLQSPTYVCTSHSTVGLSFQEWFREFSDSCVVQVSNNNGASWTSFPVYANNGLSNNDYVSSNPYTVRINISSVAANQANVKIRFKYNYNGIAGGGYNWLVDDVALSELDPVDVALGNSFVIGNWGDYGASVATVPLQFVDSLEPVTFLSNRGSNAQSSVGVSADIYRSGTNVYSQSQTYSTLPINAEDSIIEFATKYLPSATGDYTLAFNATKTGDADLSNNRDTVRFNVNDTLWSQNSGAATGRVYVHSAAAGSNPEASSYHGTRFDVPAGKQDTLTAVSVAFSSVTTAGSSVRVQIYKAGSAQWDIKVGTLIKTLTSADISTTTNTVFTRFDPDFNGVTVSDFVLDAGTYAVVVSPNHVPSSSDVAVLTTSPPNASIYAGYFGQSADAPNDANVFDFSGSSNPFATGLTEVPMVRLHFGNASKLGIDNTLITLAGNAYPNPVNDAVHIPFTMKQDANVVIELSDVLGQVVKTQNVGAVTAKQTTEATISTSDLANGMYIYTIKANGQRATGKFVVAR